MAANSLTPSQLLAAADEVLLAAGYRSAPIPDTWWELSRVFEDSYGIASVVVYDSWSELHSEWHRAQGQLVELLTSAFLRPEPKSWEGYLVLLTPGKPAPSRRQEVTSLRYDTKRVRKIVATGDDLQTIGDVEEVLLPLLPLEIEPSEISGGSLLERLPELLEAEGVPPEITRTATEAFFNNESIIERLHARRDSE